MSPFQKLLSDLGPAPDSLIRFLLQESDKRVAAQVALFLSGDARAVGLLAASATLAGAGVAIAGATFGLAEKLSLFWTASGFTAYAVAASALSVWALWPSRIDVPGWDPDQFAGDVAVGKSSKQIKLEIVAHLQTRITNQRLALLVLGSRARLAMTALAAAPVGAAGSGLMTSGQAGYGILLSVGALGGVIVVAIERMLTIKSARAAVGLKA